jgi:D-glycero-D-manno-heptose 1,7-bisphosphate phosphatase
LRSAGFQLFLVSNQPNVAKGKCTLGQLSSIHQRLLSGLAEAGIDFTYFYYCFHHPRGIVSRYSGHCECRKPSPHFLLTAGSQFDVDLRRSWMVGDRQTDIECGRAAGTRTIFIHSGELHSDHGNLPGEMASDLRAAVCLILTAD